MRIGRRIAAIGMLIAGLAGCEQERDIPEIESTDVRPIKTTVVAERSAGRTRRFAGVVEAADRTRLSFEVGGRVTEIAVDEGDRVREGDLIARLDPERYRLALQEAKAQLQQAISRRENARQTYKRRQELVKSEYVAESKFDEAQAAYERARAAVRGARAAVDRARRDLRRTRLKAPFDGTIADRAVEPSENVDAGQPLFTLNSRNAVEIAINVPEDAIGQVDRGKAVRVSFPTAGVREVPGRVTEVSSTATEGAAYPVRVAPARPTPGVQPGMTAEVRFVFATQGPDAFLVPLTAIVPHPDGQPHAYAFVYNADAGKVAKTRVRTRGVVRNKIAISKGLSQGDVIATAGVHHLRDGQAVELVEDTP